MLKDGDQPEAPITRHPVPFHRDTLDETSVTGFQSSSSYSLKDTHIQQPLPQLKVNEKILEALKRSSSSPLTITHRNDSSPTVSEDEAENLSTPRKRPADANSHGPPRKKILLKRKSLADEDVFQDEEDEEARKEQWRVGKTPGHQGSHARAPKRDSSLEGLSSPGSGDKRSLNQNIIDTAEKVLKKPFRPPARIVLAKAKPKDPSTSPSRSSSPANKSKSKNTPSSSQARSTSPSSSTPNTSDPSMRLDPAFPVFNSTPKPILPPAMSLAIRKPFKTPKSNEFSRSGAPSPASSRTRPSRPDRGGGLRLAKASGEPHKASASAGSDRPKILALERKARKLSEALSYIENPEKEEELEILIDMWRAGGREIVELLFAIMPQPNESGSPGGQGNPSSSFPPWAEMTGEPMLTDDQRDYLAQAPKNDDGDPVDYDGNLLLPEIMTHQELMRSVIVGEGKRQGTTTEYRPASMAPTSWQNTDRDSYATEQSGKPTSKPSSPWSWNPGTMLKRFQVEPSLLGWNEEDEEWVEEPER